METTSTNIGQHAMMTIPIERPAWLRQVHGRDQDNQPVVGLTIGIVTNRANTLAVSIKPSGATRFYCEVCKTIYPIKLGDCPTCAKNVGGVGPGMAVQDIVRAENQE